MLSKDLSLAHLLKLRGRPVYARNGEKIGRLQFIVYDEETGRPEWIAIRRGSLWRHTVLAPAGGLGRREDGLRLSYPAALVRSAPSLGRRDPEDARERLYRHYRLQFPSGPPAPPPETELSAAGAVTFRKWIEKRTRRHTAEIHRETLRVRRVPVYQPVEEAALGSGEIVVTLYDEHLIVTTRMVAKERIIVEKRFETGSNRTDEHPSLEHPVSDSVDQETSLQRSAAPW